MFYEVAAVGEGARTRLRRVARITPGMGLQVAYLMCRRGHEMLAGERSGLSPEGRAALDDLGRLTGDDPEFAAQLAVRQLLAMMESFARPEACRAVIEAGTTGGR